MKEKESEVQSRAAAVAAWEALFRAQVSVMRSLAASFPTDEISLNEYDVLYTLSREPERRMRLRDLNTRVLLTQPSVSRLVDRLVSRGLIAKMPDCADGRGTVISLTDDGFHLFRRVAVSHIACIRERVGEVLDDDELEQLTIICNKLRTG
ncbi:MarR family winged helix-turn-helix transcriptional regulator [Homoserinimonas sp. OAct 916]|uniref:MarR family winged helix-turn-helix transcriptional regulator n=1 Tax=Homoserinimonas sp. OAct 916 TaxID=2211450 RepID=UPI001E421D27|nr:MarR family transcriptional regulator [Homoserinimonas sp. OAct 916]